MPREPRGPPPGAPRGAPPFPRETAEPPDDRLPELEAPLAEEVVKLANSHRVAARTGAQRLIYALLANTFDDCRRQDRLRFGIAYAMMPLLLAGSLAAGLAVMAAAGWLSAAAGRAADLPPLDYALYAVPLLVLAIARAVRSHAESPAVDLDLLGGRVVGLGLGRLQKAFHAGAAAAPALYLGGAFGLMWGLLYFSRDHGGAPAAGGFGECFLLTVDNLCHGVFFDVCEMYDLRFGAKVEHTTQSATVFTLFRLAFDALVLVFLYGSWQRWRLRGLFAGLPYDVRDFDGLLDWLGRACADRRHLPARYFDEVLFLVLSKEYLLGRYDLVRQMSAQFPTLPVTPRVRALFRGPGGEVTFEGEFDG